jgi:hypothetical protein
MELSRESLALRQDQLFLLGSVQTLAVGLHALGGLESVAQSLLSTVSTSVSMDCPYGSPRSPIVGDFDSSSNMYLHCNHSPKHCWSWTGNSITCP